MNTKPSTEDVYVDKMIAKAENGDWREVLAEVARARAAHTELTGHLIRDMQTCYAAGVLHGPTECLTWLGNALAGPGNLPGDDRPDPDWYGTWMASDADRPVPENCATLTEPATAPPTNPRPGFTGMGPRAVQASDGRWWTAASDASYLVAFQEQLPESSVLRIDVDVWMSTTNAKAAEQAEFWRPATLRPEFDVLITHPGNSRPLVAFKPGFGVVDAVYLEWVRSNLPEIDGEWIVEQVGGDLGPLRWTSPDGLVWAYLMPVKFESGQPRCFVEATLSCRHDSGQGWGLVAEEAG